MCDSEWPFDVVKAKCELARSGRTFKLLATDGEDIDDLLRLDLCNLHNMVDVATGESAAKLYARRVGMEQAAGAR
jgi:hypothetical protein